MKRTFAFTLLAAAALALPGAASAKPMKADPVVAALADKTRPEADKALDAGRNPAAVLALAGIKPGMTVVDWGAGGGYYTRLFSDIVGPKGRVYATGHPKYSKPAVWEAIVKQHPNVLPQIALPEAQWLAPNSVDAIFAHLEFHDLYLPAQDGGNVPALDVPARLRNWLAALKPGGTVTIVDHVGLPGEPAVVADTLHRIDPARVRADMEAAGFVLDGSIDTLQNPADPHTGLVFDPAIRGKTDRFAMKFRKPA
ncbi:class I SAM-dependent methyltransferase [Novosphingobium cyanobacteriorum]|uniref:Methyltransferase n=1 Tax=Novosphingobium cyanobacteriorum TaxID=3024215 RepID=A0ABT6CF43_9SPHN|nr:methyltransferase [Novosphingobium cyanobacteriorum]MDF8331953.1 methyltransferase [Novosphingobium cyanobacteriorum]